MDPVKLFYLLIAIFILEAGFFNFVTKRFPHIPGDIYFYRPNFKVYIPFVSAIVLSVIISLLLNQYTNILD